jgi:hypothetical protein
MGGVGILGAEVRKPEVASLFRAKARRRGGCARQVNLFISELAFGGSLKAALAAKSRPIFAASHQDISCLRASVPPRAHHPSATGGCA